MKHSALGFSLWILSFKELPRGGTGSCPDSRGSGRIYAGATSPLLGPLAARERSSYGFSPNSWRGTLQCAHPNIEGGWSFTVQIPQTMLTHPPDVDLLVFWGKCFWHVHRESTYEFQGSPSQTASRTLRPCGDKPHLRSVCLWRFSLTARPLSQMGLHPDAPFYVLFRSPSPLMSLSSSIYSPRSNNMVWSLSKLLRPGGAGLKEMTYFSGFL